MVNTVSAFKIARIPLLYFGSGSIGNLPKCVGGYGNRILLVTGKNSFDREEVGSAVMKCLSVKEFKAHRYTVSGEPSPGVIDKAAEAFRVKNIDVVVAVGGGSVMDAGKAIAAMLCEEGTITDYLEGVGTKSPTGKKLPLIAVPTTSGTGSEATKNAVISKMGSKGFKKSLRHENYVPDIAIVDPELTMGCPSGITAYSGMDAFTQLMESFLSVASNPFTDALALSGLERVARSLQKAVHKGKDIEARTDMAYAAMLSGITLANAGLGVIHGFAQPLGSFFPVPHGVVCGTLMGAVNRKTVEKLTLAGLTDILDKYATIGKLFFKGRERTEANYTTLLLDIIDGYIEEFELPHFSKYGIKESDFEKIINATGLKNHPIPLDNEDLRIILKERL